MRYNLQNILCRLPVPAVFFLCYTWRAGIERVGFQMVQSCISHRLSSLGQVTRATGRGLHIPHACAMSSCKWLRDAMPGGSFWGYSVPSSRAVMVSNEGCAPGCQIERACLFLSFLLQKHPLLDWSGCLAFLPGKR